jgi:hypothetical protein
VRDLRSQRLNADQASGDPSDTSYAVLRERFAKEASG